MAEINRAQDLEASSFQRRPCYRYIRVSDRLPQPRDVDTTDIEQLLAKIRLFNPGGAGTWWIAAYDPETRVAFGVAEIAERGLGDIWMPELVEYRGAFGLPIERDLYYEPATLGQICRGEAR